MKNTLEMFLSLQSMNTFFFSWWVDFKFRFSCSYIHQETIFWYFPKEKNMFCLFGWWVYLWCGGCWDNEDQDIWCSSSYFGWYDICPKMRRNLISLGWLDLKGYQYLVVDGAMKVISGCLVLMKEEKCDGLYRWWGIQWVMVFLWFQWITRNMVHKITRAYVWSLLKLRQKHMLRVFRWQKMVRQFIKLKRTDRGPSLKLIRQVNSGQLHICIGRIMIGSDSVNTKLIWWHL